MIKVCYFFKMFSYKEKVRIRQMLKEGVGWQDCFFRCEKFELKGKSQQIEGKVDDIGEGVYG